MTTCSNTNLIKALQNNEAWALKQLYDTHWESMLLYAYKVLGDQALSEDIVQDIFINLWEKASQKDIKHLKAYLFKALKYKIANSIRDAKYTSLKEEHLSLIPQENNVKSAIELHDLETQVLQILDTLPSKCQNVFYLSRIKQYNNNEIAQELNISVRTVETHISNALKHFKVYMYPILVLLIWLT